MTLAWRTFARCAPSQRRFLSTTTNSVLKVESHPAPHSGHIKVLLLDIPDTRNALSKALVSSLATQVNQILSEDGNGPTRAVVLASAVDKAFCAGADLKERRTFSKEESDSLRL